LGAVLPALKQGPAPRPGRAYAGLYEGSPRKVSALTGKGASVLMPPTVRLAYRAMPLLRDAVNSPDMCALLG